MTMSLPLRTRLATSLGTLAARTSRKLGKGEGSVIGGRVTLAVDPNALVSLAAGRTTVLVSGTNGKTTTTAFLAAALQTQFPTVTNKTGSNMFGGMVAALTGSDATHVVLETDETYLPKTMQSTRPAVIALLNLTRDQLDRVGEVRMLAKKWRDAMVDTSAIVVANADDPLVVWAAEPARTKVWVEGGGSWKLDASSCPACGAHISWEESHWQCTRCDLHRPQPHCAVTREPSATDQLRLPLQLSVPGDINRHNAAIALTAAFASGADPHRAAVAVGQVESPGGRFSTVDIAGTPVRLVLAKNPAGWSEALLIARDSTAFVVSINARVQDGRDPSWLWDVPFEQLQGRFVVATGDRGRDLAVRLQYADVEHAFEEQLDDAVRRAATRTDGVIDVIGNYSAFQDYRTMAR